MPGYSHEDVELARVTLVVTCAVLKKDPDTGADMALILKRSEKEKEGPGLWTIPGGRVRESDLGEPVKINGISHNIWLGAKALERAILREIEEEAGIRLGCAFSLPGREKIFTRKDGTPTLVLVYWTICAPSATVTLGGESTEYRWVSGAELDKYEFIGNVRDDIRAALKLWSKA